MDNFEISIFMKIINIIILLLITSLVFGQDNDSKEFVRQDFIDNNLTTISVYSYTINKDGNIENDSILLRKQQFDRITNKLFGINSSTTYLSSGPSYLTWYEFETYYNDKGLVIKEVMKPENDKHYHYTIAILETEYEYDSLNREIKRTNKTINQTYSMSKRTEEISYSYTVKNLQIDEYFYNSDNQKIKWYHTRRNNKRYLNVEWKYNLDKLLTEWISYTRENRLHTKRNYVYDDQQRLIYQTDSTGWYHTTKEPYWRSITTTQYSDTGKIVTITYNIEEEINFAKIVSYYDTSNNVIKQCYLYSDNTEECAIHSFFYDNNKLVKKEDILLNGDIRITEYYYNEKGLLREESQKRNQELTQLIRYYYE